LSYKLHLAYDTKSKLFCIIKYELSLPIYR